MKPVLICYSAIALFFLIGDFCWLSFTNSRLYQPILALHLAPQTDWLAVVLFYPLYFIGILVFVVRPFEDQKVAAVIKRGILFGLVAYATYDLTNQATLSGWPWYLTSIDMAWGAMITAISASLARCVLNCAHQKSA